jgi:homoserine kinase type II
MAILTVPGDAELGSFVASYGLGALREARGIEAGTVNTSFRLELDAGTFFLRIYEEQGHEGARGEAALLVHLAGRGVPTPRPLAGAGGALVGTLAGKPAAVFPWIAGDMLCQRAVTPEAAAAVGAALGRMHLASSPPGVPLGPGRFAPHDLLRRCDRVALSVDTDARALAEPLRAALARHLTSAREDVPSGLVHGDLFRDNVLWHEGRIAALLDFESAHHGPFVYDLAVTILSWSYASDLRSDLARAITDGYRSVRELAEREREALHEEALLASLRFTITRITDDAIRVGKRWQRFVERRVALERLGPAGLREVLGL